MKSNIVFAKPDAASGSAPKPVPAPGVIAQSGAVPASVAKSNVYLPVTADIPLPEKRPATGNLRGAKSIYPFETLEVGQSFGVADKTWKNLSSTVASANARYADDSKLVALKNADGTPKMITVDVPGAGATQVQARGPERQFWGCAVDPKTDPHGATVRIWRLASDDARLVKRPRKSKAA